MPPDLALRKVGTHVTVGTGLVTAELLAHPATRGVSILLETPGSRDVDDPQVPLLRQLRAA